MNKRIVSIDILRGVTIFLMVLSANIAWNSGLPAWMFHCQVPPPDFVFNPDVKGITWVDLVFPFFIFTMGASMPFSLGEKLRKRDAEAPADHLEGRDGGNRISPENVSYRGLSQAAFF